MQALEYDDLHWLAFRYVCDEMGTEESEAFEQRLAVDQAAREAVAEAVELGHAVAVSRDEAVPMIRFARRRWMAWAAAGVAACLAVALIGSQLARLWEGAPQGGELAPLARTPDAGERLVVAWLLSDTHADTSDARVESWESETVAGPDDSNSTLTGNEADEPEVPGWMFQAVAADADANVRGDID